MLSESIDAFRRWSRHAVVVAERGMPPLTCEEFDAFDAVLLHYSIFIEQDRHLTLSARIDLRRSKAIKIVWQQDEYRNVAGLSKAFGDVGAAIVLTCMPAGVPERVYGPHLQEQPTFVSVLTGYVSDRLLRDVPPPYATRPIDIGYRGRKYPSWHGRLGAERVRLAEETRRWARARGLACDISVRERDRLYGPCWTAFLHRSKATLGTESGASVFDPDGSLPEKVWRFVLRHPLASEAKIAAATYAPIEGVVPYAQISPRIFEAIAAGSLLVLSPGRYSDLVVPGRHALTVEPSGANADEIADVIRDPERAAGVIEAARAEILHRPDLHERSFVRIVDDALEAKLGPNRGCCRPTGAVVPRMDDGPARCRGRPQTATRFGARLVRACIDRLPGRAGRLLEAAMRVGIIEARRRLRRGGR